MSLLDTLKSLLGIALTMVDVDILQENGLRLW
jgi:hypothetical protein